MAVIDDSFKEYTLDNGFHVALQRTSTPTFEARMSVYQGGLNERPDEEGIAHFLEHTVLMAGTKKYDIEQVVEMRERFMGMGATTYNDRTNFQVSGLSEDIGYFFDFFSDAIFDPRFDQGRVDDERKIILREIADGRSSPSFKDGELYRVALLGTGPHNYSTLGNPEVIRGALPSDLREFHSKGYGASNMRLTLVGGLPDDVEDRIEDYFADKPHGENIKFKFPGLSPLESSVILHQSATDLLNNTHPSESSANLTIGLRVASGHSKYNQKLSILTHILGGDMNSRLFKGVRERDGLVYGVSAGYGGEDNRGIIEIDSRISAKHISETVDSVFHEMNLLRNEPVKQKELDRIKRLQKFLTIAYSETNSGRVGVINGYLEYGITPEESLAELDSITPKDIQEVANLFLPESRSDGKYVMMIRDPLK